VRCRTSPSHIALSGLSDWLTSLDCLDRSDVLGLPALRAFDHVELHLLTFLQAFEAARLDGREVHEYVVSTLTADEAVAFAVVKPLHCSCFHIYVDVPFAQFTLKESEA